MARVGIIGGSGLDDPDLFKRNKELEMKTPFGKPTSLLSFGDIGSNEVVLIARHGRQHQFSPTEVNFRANIWALKETGVTHIIATTACGSLKEEIQRGDFVVVDQFIDFTKYRKSTFFESFKDGAHHTAMSDPFDPGLRKILYETSKELGYKTHWGGTVVTIEGPRFSTRAESGMFRIWGGDVINMSVASEAILANEVKIPYAAVAMSTDYDCWKEDEDPVSWEEIVRVFHQNAEQVTRLLIHTITKIK
ncbi:MAG: S-methyl-5'-thioadenosine phosphorylase [Thermodesulfobacteriota bacterium]